MNLAITCLTGALAQLDREVKRIDGLIAEREGLIQHRAELEAALAILRGPAPLSE